MTKHVNSPLYSSHLMEFSEVQKFLSYRITIMKVNVIVETTSGHLHKILWSKSHFISFSFSVHCFVIVKEVETFWQLIKDLGIMLDMNLSIRGIVKRLTGCLWLVSCVSQISPVINLGRGWSCWEVSCSVKSDQRRKISINFNQRLGRHSRLTWSTLIT